MNLPTKQVPTSVLVLSILSFLFGGMGLLGLLMNLVTQSLMRNNPVQQIVNQSQLYHVWMWFAIPVGVLLCLVLLAAGYGMLKLKPWARLAALGYAVAQCLMVIPGTAVTVIAMLPLLDSPNLSEPERMGAIGGMVGAVIGTFVGMLFPIALLYFLTRPKIKDAFTPYQNIGGGGGMGGNSFRRETGNPYQPPRA